MEIKTANDLAQKTCRVCGRELPETDFPKGRGGVRGGVCKECRASARRETMMRNRAQMGGGGKSAPFSDPDFDGKPIGEVWRQMCRAEKWLESRGCVITLDGEFHETKIRKLKKE